MQSKLRIHLKTDYQVSPLTSNVPIIKKISQLIYSANQLTGFYMMGTLVVKGAKKLNIFFFKNIVIFYLNKQTIQFLFSSNLYFQQNGDSKLTIFQKPMRNSVWIHGVIKFLLFWKSKNFQKQPPEQACNFIKKEPLALVFSCEFCEIFHRTPLDDCHHYH